MTGLRADAVEWAQQTLERYVGFGNKRAGGPGDADVGHWLEHELIDLNYDVARHPFEVPWTHDRVATLTCGDQSVAVLSHPGAPAATVTGPLIRLPGAGQGVDMVGRIVMIDLPHGRWSSALDARIQPRVQAAFAAGALAVVLVTHGPTGQVIALNTGVDAREFDRPVALMAPVEAERLMALDGQLATLTLDRDDGIRPAFNLIGQRDRGAGRHLVLSTPRSGWFDCAGERGSGLAAWLLLVEWAIEGVPDLDLTVLCSSAHEHSHAGARRYLADGAPCPDQTALWLHIGANAATRDWRETRDGFHALPSADAQRFLAVSASYLDAASACFAGAPGLEMPHAVADGAAGELADIVAAGHRSVAGVFGAHRFHHTAGDDLSCTSAALSVDLAKRMARFIRQVLG